MVIFIEYINENLCTSVNGLKKIFYGKIVKFSVTVVLT